MSSGLHRRIAEATEATVDAVIRACGWSAGVFVLAIFYFVLREALPALAGDLDLSEFFTSANWRPDSMIRPQFGVLALLAGTASVTALAMMIALPIGIGSAVYVSEFSGRRTRELLKILIELLASIPSVVWGFVGYMIVNPIIIEMTGAPIGVNVLNGALVLAFMSVPIIVSIGEDALRAVPDSYREAGLALGASRWQLVYRVLLPGARSGLYAAALLGIGRAVGETMAVLMATGHSVQIPHSLFDPVRTLTATIASELGETVAGEQHYRVLFVLGALLMSISLAINVGAAVIVRRVRQP